MKKLEQSVPLPKDFEIEEVGPKSQRLFLPVSQSSFFILSGFGRMNRFSFMWWLYQIDKKGWCRDLYFVVLVFNFIFFACVGGCEVHVDKMKCRWEHEGDVSVLWVSSMNLTVFFKEDFSHHLVYICPIREATSLVLFNCISTSPVCVWVCKRASMTCSTRKITIWLV